MKRGLSIRYKILMLLTLVPLVTLSVYLVIAVRIFKNDKIPYVYDSILAVSRTLASQTTTELNSALTAAKPVIQEYLIDQKFGNISKAVFDSEGQLEWIAAFHKTANGFERTGLGEKLKGTGERVLNGYKPEDLQKLLQDVSQRQRLVFTPFSKDDRVLIAERVSRDKNQDETIFLIMSRMPELANSFRASIGEVYLTNDQGLVLFGPGDMENKYLSTRISTDLFSEIRDPQNPTGTREVKSVEDRNLFASFSKANFADLAVVSFVDEEVALKAVDTLIVRSLVFFVLLIAASTIVSLVASGTLTSALTDLFGATKRVAEGKFDLKVQVRSNDEIGSLADSFNAMASEVSRLLGETAEKARMESELKTAQTVQETLFPATRADLGGFKIAGYYEPASECGGDWWHYCQVDSKVFLWIGDATGHGAPAALITSAAKSAATIIERLNVDPAHALELLNRAIYDVSKGRIMMTFFLGCFDLKTHEFTYANASHEGPYLIKLTDQGLKKKDLVPLNDVNSPRLGQDRETVYEQTTIKLEAGDRILFYTDGIPDIEDPAKTPWGEREFIKAIINCNKEFPPVSDSVDSLVKLFSDFRQGAPLKDDITFFMAHFSGEGEAQDITI